MIVPVVTINEKSPYEVKVVGQNDFLFYTCHGIKYNVGFFYEKIILRMTKFLGSSMIILIVCQQN